jgi:methylglyoxal synthase
VQIALIAHDDEKEDMVAWARDHAAFLGAHDLIATGTTGGRLTDETRLSVTRICDVRGVPLATNRATATVEGLAVAED